jgi:Interferon-induced transmembrane protein
MEDQTLDTPPGGGAPPKNYLIESVLVTVLCCLPLGIVGVINAAKVEDLWRRGDHEGAQRAADDAKKWTKYGVIAGAVFLVCYLAFLGFVFLNAKNEGAFE